MEPYLDDICHYCKKPYFHSIGLLNPDTAERLYFCSMDCMVFYKHKLDDPRKKEGAEHVKS